MTEGKDKDRVTEAKEDRQKTLDKLSGDSEARTYTPPEKGEKKGEDS